MSNLTLTTMPSLVSMSSKVSDFTGAGIEIFTFSVGKPGRPELW